MSEIPAVAKSTCNPSSRDMIVTTGSLLRRVRAGQHQVRRAFGVRLPVASNGLSARERSYAVTESEPYLLGVSRGEVC
jgi:hypothetical protein